MSDCGCVYSGYDGECGSFVTETTPKARKPHKCFECGDLIQVGQRYQRTAGKWDGRLDVYVTCLSCVEIRRALFCEGWIYGLMWEEIRESWRHGNNILKCIDNLATVAAKEKLAARYRGFIGTPNV